MKGYEVGRVCKGGEKSCQVAVADKNLRMRSDLFQINRHRITRRQQVGRSISSACANNRADIVAREHIFQFPRSAFRRTRKVQIAFQDRLEIKRLIAGTTKTVAARLQHFALHVRRGRNDSHLVAGTESARLDSRIWGSGRHLNSCHPEPSEGSAVRRKMQIPRFARDDNSSMSVMFGSGSAFRYL